jgi:methionyl-tRNA formyltransferase
VNTLIISDNQFIKENMIRIFSNHDLKYNIVESKDIDLHNVDSKYELIISAHCKKIFPPKLVNSFRCINIHPGLNPYNRGYYPQAFSLINKLPVGATIHEIDEKLDHGPIIFQEEVVIESIDTSFSLYNKIIKKEIELFENNFNSIINNNYKASIPKNEGNLNLKKDFNKLCKLDLNNVDTLENHINILKALTFDKYKNAYFIDENGDKIYLNLKLSK